MTVLTSFLGAARALALGASLALLAGCPKTVSLGDNDAGPDVCRATCPAGATVGADCRCITSGHDAGADVCTGACAVGYTLSSDCTCIPPVCAYRDPEPCTSDTICAANGGTCDTTLGHCVCPSHADAGVDAGTCPATEPTNGAPCAPDGLACPYGHNHSGCDSDSAACVGGVWQVISTPACPPDGGTDACAGPVPCAHGSHFDMAVCGCVSDDAGTGLACGDVQTCMGGQMCVRSQTIGGAVIFPDDAGHCDTSRQLDTCGSLPCCVLSPVYTCAVEPAACGGGPPTCACASSVCASAATCSVTTANEVDCTQFVP